MIKKRTFSVIALALLASTAVFSSPGARSSALASEALKMIRLEHRAIESGKPLQGPEAKAVSLFHEALDVDPDCLRRFANDEEANCGEALDRFLESSAALPAIAGKGDPASVILSVLSNTEAFTQEGNPLMVGYQAAFLLNMEELRDATTMQQLIAFLAAIDCPLTFKDLGIDTLSSDELEDLAQRAARAASGERFYKTEPYNFYLTLVRINRWGARDKGQRNGLAVADEMLNREKAFFSPLLPGLKALPAMKIVFFGDSDTDAIHWSSSAHYPEIVAGVFQRINPQVQIINAGVGGDDTGEALQRIREDVLSHDPDICFIMFGGNDSRHYDRLRPKVSTPAFVRNLAEMVVQLQEAGCTPVFMSTHMGLPEEEESPDRLVLRRHIEAMEELAGLLSLGLVQPRRILDGPDQPDMYAMDDIHLNERGQMVITREVLEWLGREAGKHLPQSSDTPKIQ